jgi:CNT family concentrative nucleoside transporter
VLNVAMPNLGAAAPYVGVLGILAILVLAFLLSNGKTRLNFRIILAAFALQAGIGLLVLYVPAGRVALNTMASGVNQLLDYSNAGINFVFGPLATQFSFALHVLPIIIFFGALLSILYYLHVMQWIVRGIGTLLQIVIGTGKIESLYAAANIFVGQSESPLVIKPYLKDLKPAQMFTLMCVGMAGIAGSLLAAYSSMGMKTEYLLAASFMGAPGGLLMAKIIMPDEKRAKDAPKEPEISLEQAKEDRAVNVFQAAGTGTMDGMKVAFAVGAMLIAFVSLIAMLNGILGGLGGLFGHPDLSFQQILGWIFSPVMYLLGIPWNEAQAAGVYFGEKLVLNEFVAFTDFSAHKTGLSNHTQAIITFALCGFANFSSIAIQLGVLGELVPERKAEIAKYGLKAVAAGSLSNLMSAAIAGLIISTLG